MMTEEEVLAFWDKNKTFQKSIDQRSPSENFVFYDGPPFATGLPHYGHILASTIKDVMPRFWTMKGKRIERTWGWDCHGLPIENIIEQKLGLKTRKDILNIGVKKFNEECRACVLEYAQDWKKTIRRMGRWVDMEHDYKTMDVEYMESLWWVFKTLWDKKLIYEGRKAMHICPRCETVLSNFEVTQGYKEVDDVAVYPLFTITNGPFKGQKIVAWTTTTWTLPGNALLAVHPEKKYVLVTVEGVGLAKPVDVILAKERLEALRINGFTVGEPKKEFPASQLVDATYEPLFPIYTKHPNAFRIVTAPFVTMEDGTGVVHIAPGFGEDDMNLGLQENVAPIMHVEMNGQFVPEVVQWVKSLKNPLFELSGIQAKPKDEPRRTDAIIAKYLLAAGKLLDKKNHTHSYPHCWRCETPLLNYSATSWFVKVTEVKDRMIELNKKDITWVPDNFREGRFGKWLDGARDWAISRSRFWGTPLPIWRAEDGEILCIGSKEELEKYSGKKITDLHKHIVDDIVITKKGKEFRRIPEVLDCWFESGSMPYAQLHYPFENKEKFEKSFPAEFIGEGQDQTRGWFYTLHVLASALKDSVAFKHVIVNGIVLAEDGKKMSKRLKNYPEPQLIIDKYGADAMRMYLCCSPAMEAESLNFSEKGVDEVYKKVTLLAQNILSFWKLYAPSVKDAAPLLTPKSDNILDHWIVTKTGTLLNEVEHALATYHIPAGARPIVEFLQDLSTWYVRRSRDRCKADGADKMQAIKTLGWTLRQLSIALAPFMPMLAEGIYQELPENETESVHLCDWPSFAKASEGKPSIVEQMEMVRRIASIAHQLRADAGVKVRQPLRKLVTSVQLSKELVAILEDEVNVKSVAFSEKQEDFRKPMVEAQGLRVSLDTTLDTALKQEGFSRELIRSINALRKKKGLTINDTITIALSGDTKEVRATVESFREHILRSTIAQSLEWASAQNGFEPISIDGTKLSIRITKV